MRVGNTVELNGVSIEFQDQVAEYYEQFDERNLVFCQYLNLRNSEFTEVDTYYLCSILLIDIVNSMIKNQDLRQCNMLKKLVRDNTQTIKTNKNVIVEEVQVLKDDSKDKMVILPVKALKHIVDTSENYKSDDVSLGAA